ncbi:MAG: tetratricopeptide repeat protein [Roseivirga sp.]|nr:tetratricopeptide repeat protein [Roseivirga sp.]
MKKNIYLLIVMMAVLWSCGDDVTREADQLFNGGQYQAAIDSYTEYLTTKPKDIKSLYNRGRAFEELGQLENARKDFTRVLDLDSDNVSANMSMGKYWYGKKSYQRAINFFDKVIQVDGRVSDAYMFKGRCYHQMGEFEDAMNGYNQAIDFDKKNAEAFLFRGALRVALNQKRKACADLTRANALGAADAGAALSKHCK